MTSPHKLHQILTPTLPDSPNNPGKHILSKKPKVLSR
ncbi:hypothetical protein CCACVL1_19347 [Corchorus capsularis]|uniref:Uncharacterized protein n=1 Tax=Corchorus capsularis TaxID=210143 RepID=A0A1R3HHC0_COCAP|nr:hypothetical protein CCACVL1_19347 [Corchorus capsularis]